MDTLLRKLGVAADLSPADRTVLTSAVLDVREVPARTPLIEEGDRPELVHVVLEGFAHRYKIVRDGGRQVLAWLTPGDFCDLQVAVLGVMDHTVATVKPCKVATIAAADVERLMATSPQLTRALVWAALTQEAVLRQWLVGLGRRDAEGGITHFFCVIHARLEAVGLTRDGRFAFPLTQADFADTMGISAVHVNRTAQALRAEGLIEWAKGELYIQDLPRLCARADFDAGYLHLDRRRARDGSAIV